MKSPSFLVVPVCAGLMALNAGCASPVRADTSQKLYLSGTDKDHTVPWEFRVASGRKSGAWSTIAVPSNWETQGFGTYTYGYNAAPNEQGSYRHTFTPPANWTGKKTFIVFEGSMTDTDVKINGVSAGPVHQGGFYRFKYDITSLVKLGQPNLLEVTVSKDSADTSVNRAERLSDYWIFGGIYRPVYLEAQPEQFIDRTAINARADGSFAVDVYPQGVTNADTVSAQILDASGKAVGRPFSAPIAAGAASTTLTTTVTAPQQWTAETPNLYSVQIRLLQGAREIHSVTQRFGFRTMEVRPGDGIYVNGRKVVLKGSCRHSFWPDTGRTTSPTINRNDLLLMKEMNMNAVRMSHYPPDQDFLDSADELGVYVLDELGGWQKRYDTGIGRKLVQETVVRDVNHPSILFWDNGNEGGWNTELDGDFALYDPQKRPVLHPWALSGGVQTDHYESYESSRQYAAGEKGNNLFMPTEFLHGLYDGGAGAGLEDYWNVMMGGRLGAGGFIWAFVDEGLVRQDRNGFIDTAGNAAPDGILGPYRQKEGSFYTIKDIWAPIQFVDRAYFSNTFPSNFTGRIEVANGYSFTDLNQCRLTWKTVNFATPFQTQSGATVAAQGNVTVPSIAPGTRGTIEMRLPFNWQNADALSLTATDPNGKEINTWVWPIKKSARYASALVQPARPANATAPATTTAAATTATESADSITMSAAGTEVSISKATGQLTSVKRDGKTFSLANGPTLAAGTATFASLSHSQEGAAHVVQANFTGNMNYVRWHLQPSGWLQLDYAYNLTGPQNFMGVNFSYPEKQVTGVKWLGQGPFRVWKNRMRGAEMGVWSKAYNDTVTGSEITAYPEFKGYHGNVKWAQLQTTEGPITVVANEDNLFLRLFTPRQPSEPRTTAAAFPSGDISLLDGIAPTGTKFDKPEVLGPQSQPNQAQGTYTRTVSFYFGAPPTK